MEIVVSPVQTQESIAYLNFKINEHKIRFNEVFPESNFMPKHHFLEHYPHLICEFGPLAALWTMRFEAKYSFFKRVVRHTSCFKNVLLSLAQRNQFLMAHHLHMWSFPKSPLEVADVTRLPIDVLKEDIAFALKQSHPELESCLLDQKCNMNYMNGMILALGSLAGLPEFVEIAQMIIVKENLLFIVKKFSAWYWKHFRAYELKPCPTRKLQLVEQHQLLDPYPLAQYRVRGMQLITLKRYIHV